MGSKRSPCMIHRTSVFKKLAQGEYSRHRLRKAQQVFKKHVEESIHETFSIRMRKDYARNFKTLVQDRILQPPPSSLSVFHAIVQVYLMIISRHIYLYKLNFSVLFIYTTLVVVPPGIRGVRPIPPSGDVHRCARIHTCQPLLGWWNQQPWFTNPRTRVKSVKVKIGISKKKPPKKSGWGVVVGVVDAIFCICWPFPKCCLFWGDLVDRTWSVERALTSWGVKLWSTTVMNSPGTSIDPSWALNRSLGCRNQQIYHRYPKKQILQHFFWVKNDTLNRMIAKLHSKKCDFHWQKPMLSNLHWAQVGTQIHHPPLTHEPRC